MEDLRGPELAGLPRSKTLSPLQEEQSSGEGSLLLSPPAEPVARAWTQGQAGVAAQMSVWLGGVLHSCLYGQANAPTPGGASRSHAPKSPP